MAAHKVLPSDFTEVSVEHILHRYNRSPKVIYLSVLVLLVIGFVSLFFIQVDVSVKAQGMLKTPGEWVYPKASGTGYVQYVNPAHIRAYTIPIYERIRCPYTGAYDAHIRTYAMLVYAALKLYEPHELYKLLYYLCPEL